jgi:hypothetical protein
VGSTSSIIVALHLVSRHPSPMCARLQSTSLSARRLYYGPYCGAVCHHMNSCSEVASANIGACYVSMSYVLTSMLLFFCVCFRYLKEVTDVELWAEGVNGTFHIEVSSITIMTGSSWM